jgi:uncharacterized protein YukE
MKRLIQEYIRDTEQRHEQHAAMLAWLRESISVATPQQLWDGTARRQFDAAYGDGMQ